MSKRRDANLYLAGRPLDGRNGQRAAGEGLADRGARRRAVKRAAEADERGYLGRAALRLEIAVFVEKRLAGVIIFTKRGPVDLAAEQRLRIKVATPGRCRAFELTDRHAILVQDAQLELVDGRALRRARFVDGQAKIAARGRAPPEAVAAAIAGQDAANFAKALAFIGEVNREVGSVSGAPFDERPERRAHITEVDRDALAFGKLHRGIAERRNPPLFHHRCRVAGTVKVDLDDLLSSLGLRVVAGPAHESRLDRRESEDVLSALAVARPTKMGPSLAVERGLEPVDDRRIRAPIDLESGEGRGLAKVDFEPRLFRRLRLPSRGVAIVDGETRIAAAGGRLPPILARRLHGALRSIAPRAPDRLHHRRREPPPGLPGHARVRSLRDFLRPGVTIRLPNWRRSPKAWRMSMLA